MKRILAGAMILGLVVAITGSVGGREKPDKKIRIKQQWSQDQYSGADIPSALEAYHTSATVDTYTVVSYDFELKNWQGWTRRDNTAQRGTFFHVDDFAGLGGGDFGRLVPIEGTKSMWCGVRPNTGDPYVCNWIKAPGYGNDWDQSLTTETLHFTGAVTFSYRLAYDTEPDYDFVRVEYDNGYWGSDWQELAAYSGVGDTVASHVIYTTRHATKLRFHFESDGGMSDMDGLRNSDGACIVDELHVSDAGTLNDYQTFETAMVGAPRYGIWLGMTPVSYGNYSGLWNNLIDDDPCGENLSSQIVFFVGSPPGEGLYPTTPFCRGSGGIHQPCQDEMALSPLIDLTRYSTTGGSVQDAAIPPGELGDLGGATLSYTVYRDLPLANLVFYCVEVEDISNSGCPWNPSFFFVDWFWYYGQDREYLRISEDMSYYTGRKYIQVAFRVRDMCDSWYLVHGDCAAHTSTPWFDNVKVQRYRTVGPQWAYRDFDLFQDNFPSTDDVESYVRADAAGDINAAGNPVIRPGDSVVVSCASPVGGGIAEDAGGPRVYMHVRCTCIGYPVKPPLAGPQLEGTYGHYVSDDGTWTIIQCDTARAGDDIDGDRYMVDLDDALFTRGYMVEYYFKAYDNEGQSSALPRGADHLVVESPYQGSSYYFEFTCLPTGTSDMLYVDDFDGIGSFDGVVQNYFDRTFKDVYGQPYFSQYLAPDRYDVKAPTSLVSNSLASRARLSHLLAWYNLIIWDSGDLSVGTICDGTAGGDKSDDCTLLAAWMDASEGYQHGVWILGDNVAAELAARSTPQSQALLGMWCGVALKNGSYFDLTGGLEGGGVVSPLVTGVSATFITGGIPDKFYTYGGCPAINDFDVLEKAASGQYALTYPDFGGEAQYAAIQAERTNSAGKLARAMWFGFSWMSTRDDVGATPMDRSWTYREVTRGWLMGQLINVNITGGDVPRTYRLAQNYPNPFNPSTTIKFDMKEKGLVTVKIYDVAGRLVRTLANEVRDAGAYSILWDGRNNLGADAASGIYFYKMETAGFSATKKLVLLR
jgi:hypothetical protein